MVFAISTETVGGTATMRIVGWNLNNTESIGSVQGTQSFNILVREANFSGCFPMAHTFPAIGCLNSEKR